MKIAVVIPPWLHPTSPPLGPACLSSFLKAHNKHLDVRVFDLNIRYYYQALKFCQGGKIGVSIYGWKPKKTAERVKQAFEFLKENHLSLVSAKKWHENATIFLSFENILNGFMAEMAARSLFNLDIPGAINGFLGGLTDEVIDFSPELCAISVSFDTQMPFALAISRMIKEGTDAFICLGGARFGTSPHPQRLFEKGISLKVRGQERHLEDIPCVDAIIPGEGEIPLLKLCRSLKQGNPREVPGLVYRASKRVIFTRPPEPLNMNQLPVPDFSDLDLSAYMTPEPVLPFMTSRGCAWGKCTFCTHHKGYIRYRQMAISEVVRQLKEMKNAYNTRFFTFFDEMIPPGRVRTLSIELIKEGLDIFFSAYGKPVRAFDSALMTLSFKAGCRVMLWGVESGSQKILDLMGKGTRVKDIELALRASHEAGVRNLLFIMFGFPGEGTNDFKQTIDFLKRNRDYIDAISKGLFILIEGCDVQKKPERFFIKKMRQVADNFSGAISYDFETISGLDRKEVEKLYKKHLPFLEKLGISPRLGVYREHLLF